MKRIIPVTLIFGLSLIISCKSGHKALKNGDYYLAVIEAVDRLQGNPDHKKASQILKEGYPLAVDWYFDQAQNTVNANEPHKWESVVNSYSHINQMYEAIKRSPAAMRIVKNPINYYDEIGGAKEKAAGIRYQEGLVELSRGSRESARTAYYHFDRADDLVPGFKDIEEKRIEALDKGTLRVLVEQIPLPSRRYQLSAEFFQNQVDEYLANYGRNMFVRFHTELDRNQPRNPDQVVQLRFEDFVVGQTHLHEKEQTVTSSDSVEVGTVTLDDGTSQTVYGLVSARLTTFRKQVLSGGVLSMVITDGQTERVIADERFPGEFDWFCEWATFNGDERALTSDQKRLCGVNTLPPPPPQDLFVEFTRPIYNQVTARLNRIYKHY